MQAPPGILGYMNGMRNLWQQRAPDIETREWVVRSTIPERGLAWVPKVVVRDRLWEQPSAVMATKVDDFPSDNQRHHDVQEFLNHFFKWKEARRGIERWSEDLRTHWCPMMLRTLKEEEVEKRRIWLTECKSKQSVSEVGMLLSPVCIGKKYLLLLPFMSYKEPNEAIINDL